MKKKMNISMVHRLVTLSILILLMLILAIYSPHYRTFSNFVNVLRQSALTLIIASAATMLMISGGMDLSPAGVMALVAVVVAKAASSGVPLPAAIALGLCLSAAAGALSGVLVTFANVPPMIATMGVWYVTKGLAYVLSESAPIVRGLPDNYAWINSFVGKIPLLIIIAALVFAVFYILLNFTLLGKHAYAIGGNKETARLSGVKVKGVTVLLYVLAALMSGLAGVLQSSRICSGDPNFSTNGMEFDVIVAIVVGGTSLMGGRGSLIGTFIGVMILSNLSNGMNLLGLGNVYQIIVQGIVLILAVVLDLTLKGSGINLRGIKNGICKLIGKLKS